VSSEASINLITLQEGEFYHHRYSSCCAQAHFLVAAVVLAEHCIIQKQYRAKKPDVAPRRPP
jgi:hypothetical protein